MNLEELRKLVKEACGDHELPQPVLPGPEAQHGKAKMARTDLITIGRDVQELLNMFGDEADLPEEVEAKIVKAADYINSVRKYLGGEVVRQSQPGAVPIEPIQEDLNQDQMAVSAAEAIGGEEDERKAEMMSQIVSLVATKSANELEQIINTITK